MKKSLFSKDAIQSATVKSGRPCLVERWLRTVTSDERKEFDSALQDHSFTLPLIQRVISARGAMLSISTLHNHRYQRCVHCYGNPI